MVEENKIQFFIRLTLTAIKKQTNVLDLLRLSPERAGSLFPPLRPGGVGRRICFSLSIFRFSNLFKACTDMHIPPDPTPPLDSATPMFPFSSCVVRSSRLPAAFRFISTPLSLLLALPSGERSLLQDDWPPGLGWDFWRNEREMINLTISITMSNELKLKMVNQCSCLTSVVSGASNLQSSLLLSSFSIRSSELWPAGVSPGGRGPVSPRCFLVMWASGPCTVFTCFLRELGSV